jgi:uncharacterized iron-regulated membrane protein
MVILRRAGWLVAILVALFVVSLAADGLAHVGLDGWPALVVSLTLVVLVSGWSLAWRRRQALPQPSRRIVVSSERFLGYLAAGVVILLIGSFLSGSLIYLADAAVAIWAGAGLLWLWRASRRAGDS